MAAEFENFVQQELPRRPYVTTNPSQETIPVRRGPGPRQLEFVDIAEGEVLGKSGGVITGLSVLSISNCKGFAYEKPIAEAVWTIAHLQNTRNVQVTVYDVEGAIIFPDKVTVVDVDTVQISFAGAQDGRAVLILFPSTTPEPPPPAVFF
jgi:hypothetical protein